MLAVEGIEKRIEAVQVIKYINFNQLRFQKLVIAGETGSGKSTLLKIIAGLVQPDAGNVFYEGERVLGPDEKLIAGHKDIAYLSQHFELRNNYWVEDMLMLANQLDSEKTASIYRICKIQHLLRRKTQQLSGGEKQRVATARLLMTSPSLLLLDEPFSNLNVAYKQLMKSVINDICTELNISIVMVSHDPADILPWADHILVLKSGELVHSGSPRVLYNHPPDAYTAGLFGRYNTIDQSIQRIIGLHSEAAAILIRPCALEIQVNEEFINGYISAVAYYGGYEEIEVEVSGTKIWVMSGIMNIWKVGDFVQVSVRQSFFEA
jgi:ABC-type sugar transport system ATPase subunit